MTDQSDKKIGRREFIARVGKAGLAITAGGAACAKLYDSKGPAAMIEAKEQVTLPDFSIATHPGQVMSIVTGSDRTKSVEAGIKAIGGIGRFIKDGDIVGIKPNAGFATPSMLGATANPQLVAAVVKLCYAAGAKKVIVADNPINNPATCFTISGIGTAARQAKAEVILPRDGLFRHTTLAGGKLIRDWPIFYGPFSRVDKLIGISPVKHHLRSGASMSMKNWYGLLGGRRNIFHQDINTIIAELAMMVNPTFVILDGVQSMMTNGPTGGAVSDLKQTNTLIVSCDMVAADSFGCSLLGHKPSDLPYLTKAADAGAGTTDYESIKPVIISAG